MNQPTKKFLCSYPHDGGRWSITIDAYDWQDAEARVKKLGYLKLDGEHVMTIRDGPGVGMLVSAMCKIRNFFFKP